MEWITQNWVNIIAALYALECFLSLVAPMTPWKFDDNIAGWLSKLLKQFFPKK